MDISETIKQVKPLININQKTSLNLILTGRWIFNLHNEHFKTFGITIQKYNILRILRGQYPNSTTIKYVREQMIDKMSDASRLVEKLRIKGLVTRELNTDSRRKVDVMITPKGLDLLIFIEKKGGNTLENLLSNLRQNEIEQLNALLDKLRGLSAILSSAFFFFPEFN